MGEPATAVETLPLQGRVREDVHRVPGQLLRDEGVTAGQPRDLRQTGGVAERVRKPEGVGTLAEGVLQPRLPEQELAGEGLPRRHVPVGLDPGASEQQPSAFGHPLPDPLEHLGLELGHPRQVLHLGGREPHLGFLLHQREHVAEGAGDLADGLPERPQPRRVDMGVGDGVQARGVGRGLAVEHWREGFLEQVPPLVVGDGQVIDHVAGGVDRAQHMGPACPVGHLAGDLQR